MGQILNIFIPAASNALKGVALQAAARQAFANNKALATGTSDKLQLNKYNGVPFVTNLSLRAGGVTIILQSCVCVVNMEKNIVKTPIQGRNGTIKEFISDGDYSISIEANITKEYLAQTQSNTDDGYSLTDNFHSFDDYPVTELKPVIELLKKAESIDVASDFLDMFGIKSIVITNYSMPQETHSNIQTLTMSALSDEPYEIFLITQK